MQLYGLDEIARSISGPDGCDAYSLITKKFSKRSPPKRAATMGRDPAVTQSNTKFIDYIAFCMAVEPRFNSRDQDNLSRLLAKQRDVRLGQTVEDKIPLSNTVKNLNAKVSAFKKGLEEKAAEERREMVKLSEEALRKQRAMRVPMAKSEEDFVVPPRRA